MAKFKKPTSNRSKRPTSTPNQSTDFSKVKIKRNRNGKVTKVTKGYTKSHLKAKGMAGNREVQLRKIAAQERTAIASTLGSEVAVGATGTTLGTSALSQNQQVNGGMTNGTLGRDEENDYDQSSGSATGRPW